MEIFPDDNVSRCSSSSNAAIGNESDLPNSLILTMIKSNMRDVTISSHVLLWFGLM